MSRCVIWHDPCVSPAAVGVGTRKLNLLKSNENTWQKGGKVTLVAKATVPKDGKTLTMTQTGPDSEGRAVTISL